MHIHKILNISHRLNADIISNAWVVYISWEKYKNSSFLFYSSYLLIVLNQKQVVCKLLQLIPVKRTYIPYFQETMGIENNIYKISSKYLIKKKLD